MAGAARPTDPSKGAPPVGGSTARFHNSFWVDRGTRLGVVAGTARSSWIVDPPDGRMPVSDAGRLRIKAILAQRSFDGPEGLTPADRCLVPSRRSGGPPMLNNLYNNAYRIVQTTDHATILVEMIHDARIIRLGTAEKPPSHGSAAIRRWLGDSIGRWEGDTLVVETRHWHPAQGDYEPVYLSSDALVIERFTRVAADELHHEFIVDDPGFCTRRRRGEMTFAPASGPVYEYACHEGNYALSGISAGARLEEREKP